jgi:hypothetical protein
VYSGLDGLGCDKGDPYDDPHDRELPCLTVMATHPSEQPVSRPRMASVQVEHDLSDISMLERVLAPSEHGRQMLLDLGGRV